MPARPRYKESTVDEEKIKHFSKKFEEQDMPFDDPSAHSKSKQDDDVRMKSVLYKFAEIDAPKEEKKQEHHLKERETKHEESSVSSSPQPEKVVISHQETNFRASAADDTGSAPNDRPLSKAEAYAVQHYQARLGEEKKSRFWKPLLTGFLFGLGLLLFALFVFAILFSIAVAKGVTIPELLQILV